MKIYHYDNLGILTGDSEADEDQLNPGKFLIPANATDMAPVGNENAFKTGAWSYQEDNRGKQVWSLSDGSTSIVDYIGAIKLGFTMNTPVSGTIFVEGSWVIDINGLSAVARIKRDGMLAATDYMMLSDAVIVNGVKEYRQALRDLPANPVWPIDIVWPVL